VLRREPELEPEGLRGGAVYYDAGTDDARLTLLTALGARDAGATVVTHASVTGVAFERGGVRLAVRDALGGDVVEARSRVAVNATGPWSDDIRRCAGEDPRAHVLGAKGAHVAVPASRVGNRGAVTLVSRVDGRVMFVLPAGGFTIIGTTETPAERGPDEVRASARDVDYLLRSANAAFPDAHLERDDVVAAWAGIRPLAAVRASARSTASVSREHVIETDPRGLVTVSGGKLTTYRAMAADIVDAAAALLNSGTAHPHTATLPLPGGDVTSIDALDMEVARTIGDDAVAARLARAYGSEWRRVWSHVERDRSLGRRLVSGLPYLAAELVHGVEHELALTLTDLLVRRVPLAYETRDAGRSVAPIAAAIVAPLLGWDDAAVEREIAAYGREADRIFAVDET
jgi:glycerol-3-phosphate dehydrogenase